MARESRATESRWGGVLGRAKLWPGSLACVVATQRDAGVSRDRFATASLSLVSSSALCRPWTLNVVGSAF